MGEMDTLEDAFKGGVAVAVSLFMMIYIVAMLSADSISEVTEVFSTAMVVASLSIVPTTPAGMVISFLAATVGAIISLDDWDPSLARAAFAFGFIWMVITLVGNLLTANALL